MIMKARCLFNLTDSPYFVDHTLQRLPKPRFPSHGSVCRIREPQCLRQPPRALFHLRNTPVLLVFDQITIPDECSMLEIGCGPGYSVSTPIPGSYGTV